MAPPLRKVSSGTLAPSQKTVALFKKLCKLSGLQSILTSNALFMTLNPHQSQVVLSTPYGDHRVSVWRTGKIGAPFLFLHGWGRDHSSFLPLASLLEDLGEMIFVD